MRTVIKESNVLSAEELKHYFVYECEYQKFDVSMQENILHAAQFCICALFLHVAHFLCSSWIVRSNTWSELLFRTSFGTQICMLLLSDGRSEFSGYDTDEVFMCAQTILKRILVVELFHLPCCTAQQHLKQLHQSCFLKSGKYHSFAEILSSTC